MIYECDSVAGGGGGKGEGEDDAVDISSEAGGMRCGVGSEGYMENDI